MLAYNGMKSCPEFASGAPPSPEPSEFNQTHLGGWVHCWCGGSHARTWIEYGERGFPPVAPVASPLPEQTSEYCYHTPSDSCDSDCANQEFADERAESYFRSQAPVPPVAIPTEPEPSHRHDVMGADGGCLWCEMGPRRVSKDWIPAALPSEPTSSLCRNCGDYRDLSARYEEVASENESLRARLGVNTIVGHILSADDDIRQENESLRSRLSAVQSAHRLSVSCAGSVLSKLEAAQADLASLRSRLTEAETERIAFERVALEKLGGESGGAFSPRQCAILGVHYPREPLPPFDNAARNERLVALRLRSAHLR